MTDIRLYENDLPDDLNVSGAVAIDTETQGLHLQRDRLCLVQLCFGDDVCHLVKFNGDDYNAPRLKKLLTDPAIEKIFHYARFDIAVLERWLSVKTNPLYCTKIASKLVRTYGAAHGLSALCSELLGIELDKGQQTTDWRMPVLTQKQKEYAANDVLYLHALRKKLDEMLARENRTALAQACFSYLPARAALDLEGFGDMDIFSHH